MEDFNLTYQEAFNLMEQGKVCELSFELGNIKFSRKGNKLFVCRAEKKDKSIWVASHYKESFLDGKWRLINE